MVLFRASLVLQQERLSPVTAFTSKIVGWRREPADAGLLSPELAAGIRRVKGSKRLGVRLGNWLTAEQAGVLRLWSLFLTNDNI